MVTVRWNCPACHKVNQVILKARHYRQCQYCAEWFSYGEILESAVEELIGSIERVVPDTLQVLRIMASEQNQELWITDSVLRDSLDKLASRLGYDSAEHLEQIIEEDSHSDNYGLFESQE